LSGNDNEEHYVASIFFNAEIVCSVDKCRRLSLYTCHVLNVIRDLQVCCCKQIVFRVAKSAFFIIISPG